MVPLALVGSMCTADWTCGPLCPAGWDVLGFAERDRNTSKITTSVLLKNVALLRTYCIPVQWVQDPAVSRDIQARRPQAAYPGVQVVTPLDANMTYCFMPQPTSSVPAGSAPPAVAGGARRLQARTQPQPGQPAAQRMPPLGAPTRRLLHQGPDEEAGPAAVVGAHAAIEGPVSTNHRCWPATAGWLVRDGVFEAVQIDAGGAGSYAAANYWFVLRGAHALCDYVSDVACVRQYGPDNCEVARVGMEVIQPPSAAALAAGPGPGPVPAATSSKSSRDVLPIVLPCVLGGELHRRFAAITCLHRINACVAAVTATCGRCNSVMSCSTRDSVMQHAGVFSRAMVALALRARPPAERIRGPTTRGHCTALHCIVLHCHHGTVGSAGLAMASRAAMACGMWLRLQASHCLWWRLRLALCTAGGWAGVTAPPPRPQAPRRRSGAPHKAANTTSAHMPRSWAVAQV